MEISEHKEFWNYLCNVNLPLQGWRKKGCKSVRWKYIVGYDWWKCIDDHHWWKCNEVHHCWKWYSTPLMEIYCWNILLWWRRWNQIILLEIYWRWRRGKKQMKLNSSFFTSNAHWKWWHFCVNASMFAWRYVNMCWSCLSDIFQCLNCLSSHILPNNSVQSLCCFETVGRN